MYVFFIAGSEVRVSEVRSNHNPEGYWCIDEVCHSRTAAFAVGVGVPLEWADEQGWFERNLGPSYNCEI